MKLETFLPVFSGFYNTIWDDLTDIDSALALADLEPDEVEALDLDNIDYNKAHEDLARAIVNTMDAPQFKPAFIKSMTFQKLVSPREYNFTNDSIDVEIDVDKKALDTWYKEVRQGQAFKDYLKERFTSHDGFSSFFENHPNSEDWEKVTERNIGWILDFAFIEEGTEEMDIMDSVQGNFSMFDYVPNLAA